MCGIFGGIGQNVNTGIIRALAVANRDRGKQSMGLFDSNGKAIKAGIDPFKALAHAEFTAFMNNTERWFLAGHTRHATHGKINDANAHPFRFGRIIGAHNGVVHTPYDSDYTVDSEYLFDQLNRHDGNYQPAFADIAGYWGLSWFDGQHFYLQAHGNEIAVALAADGNWYYSSDEAHLAACIGSEEKMVVLDKGRTIRFIGATELPEIMPDFVSNIKATFDRWSWRSYSAPTTAASSATAPAMSAAAYNQRQLPSVYRETKAERKRRKRAERKARRDGYGAASTNSGRISHDEFDLANAMAQEAGYRDLADFMWQEDCETETQAIGMLERALKDIYADDPGAKPYDLFATDDEKSVVVGLDMIPF
jgi:hypothetical protein